MDDDDVIIYSINANDAPLRGRGIAKASRRRLMPLPVSRENQPTLALHCKRRNSVNLIPFDMRRLSSRQEASCAYREQIGARDMMMVTISARRIREKNSSAQFVAGAVEAVCFS